MSASDFDDIFGDDPKLDATTAPTLTNVDLDDDEIFGGTPSSKVEKPAVAGEAHDTQANWAQIGSHEQDEFLSWLDEGPAQPAATPLPANTGSRTSEEGAATPTSAPAAVPSAGFDSVSLDDDDDFDQVVQTAAKSTEARSPAEAAAVPPVPPFDSVSLDDDNDFDRIVASVSNPPEPTPPAPTFDDVDDFDRIVQNASMPSNSTPPPAPSLAAPNGISDDDDFDRIVQSAHKPAEATEVDPPATVTSIATPSAISFDDDDDLEQLMKNASAGIPAQPAQPNSISLDDDDDDDLEKIIQSANKKANASSSRENSSSSLQIKSQVQAQHKAQQIDVAAARQTFLDTGVLPAGSRLAVWQRAVQPGSQDSASMYAVQTTSRTLPSQTLLRKEVEALCSRIFASGAHARVLSEAGDSMRGTHLLFIDGAETLFTHFCHQFDLDYVSGMATTFAPLLLASGSEPLHPEIVGVMAATCRRFLPHLVQKLPISSSASGRRALLKRLLLYHAPRLASHLKENFPTWNNAPAEEYDASCGGEGSGAIPHSWIASFFESESMVNDPNNFEFLLKVWDCSLVMEAYSSNDNTPLTTSCFVALYAIVAAEKALLRMQGEQLRHCMVTTLAETLLRGEATKDDVFVRNVRRLVDATPPCFYSKLRGAGLPQAPVVESTATDTLTAATPAGSNGNFGMNSLLSASTQGVKDLSNLMIDMPVKLMIDMPVKLLTMVPLNPMAALSSPTSNSLTDSPETQQLFYLHVQAMEVAAVSMTLDPCEVIPSVFGGIQGHDTTTGSIRYFIVDCRGAEEMRAGQVPTAFHFDPDTVADQAVLDQVLAVLNPLKNAGVHICVMGQGYAHVAEELRQFQEKQGVASASPFSLSESFLETYANDQTRVQGTIEFLLQHEFPHVSVLDGGYSAAHGHLFRSHSLTVDDLADHDVPNCLLCQHDRAMVAVQAPANAAVVEAAPLDEKKAYTAERGASFATRTSSSRTSESDTGHISLASDEHSGFTDINLSPANAPANPGKSSYYSSFAGALKTGGKTILSPTMDGTKWLLKKSAATTAEFASAAANMGNKTRTGSLHGANVGGKPPVSPAASPSTARASPSAAMPNLNKLRNSLASIGSESLDMLKKMESAVEHAVEQAAVATTTSTAKVRVPFPSAMSPSPKDAPGTSPATANTSTTPRPDAPRATLSSDPAHRGFFHQSTDEMFTIDDDDDDEDHEGHFVQDFGGERTSSTSSFQNDSPCASAGGVAAVHEVVKGHVNELTKGLTVSRAQLQPCVQSPFFACYKKKPPIPGSASRSNMHARRVVVMENHLVVLKAATKHEDDLYIVKSCHPLGHVSRMTCLKKNALMVSIYYKWKAVSGEIVERRNSYEVQQRDDFIKAVKSTMDKM